MITLRVTYCAKYARYRIREFLTDVVPHSTDNIRTDLQAMRYLRKQSEAANRYTSKMFHHKPIWVEILKSKIKK